MISSVGKENLKKILIKSLKESLIILKINSNLLNNNFLDNIKKDYNNKNDFTIDNIKSLILKIKEDITLNSMEVSVINRSIVDYIDKLNKYQSHLIYMTEDNNLNNINKVREQIKGVYIAHNVFNQSHIEKRVQFELENNIEKKPTYNIETIINALEEAKQFTIHNYKMLENTFADVNIEDLKENYLEKNDCVLSLISNTIKSLKNETPLKCNEVSLINAALVKYIQKLETHQSNNLCLLINTNDIKIFKDQIKNIYFEIVKFNDSFLLEKL